MYYEKFIYVDVYEYSLLLLLSVEDEVVILTITENCVSNEVHLRRRIRLSFTSASVSGG